MLFVMAIVSAVGLREENELFKVLVDWKQLNKVQWQVRPLIEVDV